MLNLFVSTTTFGQHFGACFDLSIEGTLANKRLTAIEDCVVNDPIYTKELTPERIAEYIAQGKKTENLSKAVETENIRVNSLYALINQLKFVQTMNTNEVIIAYVPTALLNEIISGKHKFALASDKEQTYYSEFELSLWTEANELIKEMYDRIVFKDIAKCQRNISNTPVQADRVAINKEIYGMLLKAYREEKTNRATQAKQNKQQQVSELKAF